MKRSCHIKDSIEIRKLLTERFEELKMTWKDVLADARTFGVKIDRANASRYNTMSPDKHNLSQEHILWLCARWSISVDLEIKKLEHDEGKAVLAAKEKMKKKAS